MNKIAIVGVSGRFPNANNVEELWQAVVNGQNCIQHWEDSDGKQDIESKIVHSRGVLDDVFGFDAQFFNMSESEVMVLDPQNRIFLECVWEAFENAGYCWDHIPKNTAIYASSAPSTYLFKEDFNNQNEKMKIFLGNSQDFFATKISYQLNLICESVNVQTACSSSLAAVYMACQSLNNSNCDMAIVGGSNILLPQRSGYFYQEGLMYSKDGVCRPFDAEASGMVESNAVNVVLLKRLEDAEKDRDNIIAVICGGAMNNDGNDKLGYTAPSISGQSSVIRKALKDANKNPEDVGFIETHGTGTQLGDVIEISALKEVYNNVEDDVYLGAVKGNIGHTVRASGLSGLIVSALVLKNHLIPPMANNKIINPNLNIDDSCFKICRTPTEWNRNDGSYVAGVSSFGFGGTNVHLILEEYRSNEKMSFDNQTEVLALSARNDKELIQYRDFLLDYLEENQNVNLHDFSYTINSGRRIFGVKHGFVFNSYEELITKLKSLSVDNNYINDGLYKLLNIWLSGKDDYIVRNYYIKNGGKKIQLPIYPLNKSDYIHRLYIDKETIINNVEDREKASSDVDSINSETSILSFVSEQFAKSTSEKSFQMNDSFYALGIDSIDYIGIVVECENRFNIQMKWGDAFLNNTPETLAKLCSQLIMEKGSHIE